MTPQPHPLHRRAFMHHRAVRRSAIVLAAGLLLAGAPLVARALDDEGVGVAPVLEVASPIAIEPSPVVDGSNAPALLELGAGLAVEPVEPDAEPTVEPEPIQPVAPSVDPVDDSSIEVTDVVDPADAIPADDIPTDAIPTETLPPGTDPSQWAALRDCESGGDYLITNPSGKYRGAYQFDRSTWDSVASRHASALVGIDPAAASPAEQDAMAMALYSERGAGPWPHCGRHLG